MDEWEKDNNVYVCVQGDDGDAQASGGWVGDGIGQ